MNEKMNISLFSTDDIWWDYYTDFDTYWKKSQEEEEIVQNLTLSPETTGVDVDIFIDTNEMFRRLDHPLWMYFRNGTREDPFEVIPMSISDNPQILLADYDLRISDEVIYQIKEFIKKNKDILIKVGAGYMSQTDFMKSYSAVRTWKEIFEMSTLTPDISKLPVSIWIDNTGAQYGSNHNGSMRIKFAARKGPVKTRDMIPITVSKTNPEIPNSVLKTNPEARKVDPKILKEVKRFIILNYDPLIQVLTKKIRFEDQFIYRICTSFDSEGNPIYPQRDPSKSKYTGRYIGGKFREIVSNLGEYNYTDAMGRSILSDDWFDNIKDNISGEPNVLAYAYVADKKFKIHNNGYAEYIDERPFMERYREDKLKESRQEIDCDFWNIGGIGNLY